MKILIGAVLAATLLAMVYVITSQMSSPYGGYDTVKEMLRQAQNGPNLCFTRDSVQLISGEDYSGFGAKDVSSIGDIFKAGTKIIDKTITTSISVKCTGTTAAMCTIKMGSKNC